MRSLSLLCVSEGGELHVGRFPDHVHGSIIANPSRLNLAAWVITSSEPRPRATSETRSALSPSPPLSSHHVLTQHARQRKQRRNMSLFSVIYSRRCRSHPGGELHPLRKQNRSTLQTRSRTRSIQRASNRERRYFHRFWTQLSTRFTSTQLLRMSRDKVRARRLLFGA